MKTILLFCLLLFVATAARPEDIFVLPEFDSEEEAKAQSRAAMLARQTEKTRNDPKTGTLYLYGWSKSNQRNKWALHIPASLTNGLDTAAQAKLKKRDNTEWAEERNQPGEK